MYILALINFGFLILIALIHLVMGYLFSRYVVNTPRIELPTDFAPKAVVVMSLRGHDPFLRDTLLSLLKQNYPNYSIRVIVDGKTDPTWELVEEIASTSDEIEFDFQELKNRSQTCGLKCSAIVQAVELMNSEDEILVLSDADVVPDANWLRDLVAPLSDDKIGVTTGNQWFSPREGKLGSIIRNVWHAGAIIPTLLYGNPWGGSCAMRLQDIRENGLFEKWKSSIVDDGPICEMYAPTGKMIYVIPSLVIVNREECSVKFCFTYIRRMLTWSRIYENTFFLTPMHVFTMFASLFVAVFLFFWGLSVGPKIVSVFAGTGLTLFGLSMLMTYLLADRAVVYSVSQRGQTLDRTGIGRILKMGYFFPFAIAIYCWSLLPAIFSRRIRWREVTYEINGRWDIKMIEDQPYPNSKHEVDGSRSV